MNFSELIEHHILNHPIKYLFSVNGVGVYLGTHGVAMVIVGIILFVLLMIARRQYGKTPHGLANFFEVFIVFVRDDIVTPNLGDAGDEYLPYFMTLFFFILGCNMAGLVPWGVTATGNISVTAGLAITTFLLIHFAGIKKLGVWHYLQTYVPHGLPFWLVPLMFIIEIMGLFTKSFALCIRLFANMIAGHIVILAFMSLIFIFHSIAVAPMSVLAAAGLGLLELFVAVLQAYVFVLLTAVFVGGAVNPQH